jgi:Cu/Ag efflux protein CusF
MKVFNSLRLHVLVLWLFLPGCKAETTTTPAGGNNEYDLRGKVVALDVARPAVTLDHEDVPGLMKAMKMEFPVENPKLLAGIKVGDQVQGRLKKSESGYLITRLEKRRGQ